MKRSNPSREVSKATSETFAELGTDILKRFATLVETKVSHDGERTRVKPSHIEAAHSQFLREIE
jgi:hypothetical protein